MRRAKYQFLLGVLLMALSGCGTTLVNMIEIKDQGRVVIFGGVRTDVIGCVLIPALAPLFILDLPLSLVMDTILLPLGIITYDERDPSLFRGLGGC